MAQEIHRFKKSEVLKLQKLYKSESPEEALYLWAIEQGAGYGGNDIKTGKTYVKITEV